MNKAKKDSLKFLEKKLHWCKEQDRLLEKIETKLYEMRETAEYAATNNLNPLETKKLQDKIDQLQEEVASLQTQLYPSEITH